MSHGVCAQVSPYQRHASEASISKCFNASSKRCQPTNSGIRQSTIVMDDLYLLCLVHINQPTLVMVFPYWLWLVHIVQSFRAWTAYNALGLNTKIDQRREMSVCINFACGQWSNDVGQGLPASPFYYTQWSAERGLPPFPLSFTKHSADVGCELPASSPSCTHWSADVENGLTTSSVAWIGLLCQKQPSSIARSLHKPVCQHRIWPTTIVNSLHTSVYRCRPMESKINQGLHAFNVVCTYLESDISQWRGT